MISQSVKQLSQDPKQEMLIDYLYRSGESVKSDPNDYSTTKNGNIIEKVSNPKQGLRD